MLCLKIATQNPKPVKLQVWGNIARTSVKKKKEGYKDGNKKENEK